MININLKLIYSVEIHGRTNNRNEYEDLRNVVKATLGNNDMVTKTITCINDTTKKL